MLEHSDLLIFHGGQNTLVNALQHRVLSIVFPCLIFERDFNARMIESMGAGIRLPHAEFRPAPLYDTASQLWRRGPRREALEVGKSLASTDGPGYLVRILKEYAAKG
jgi:UDP:flavonoid glycosyltransferase YjiC (YdhE family)